jgi:transketolase
MLIDMRDAFFEELVLKAKENPNIVVLSADHGAFALEDFAENNPNQYINIGIAEQNMVGVAAGLAASGKIVFIYGITPFVSLRVLEQITLDVAAMQLPVNVISVGAGFTYSTDGSTHLGLQDIGVISSIPGMNILNSSDPINTRAFVNIAINDLKPNYIRIEKEKLASFKRINPNFMHDGYSVLSTLDADFCIITTGSISHDCLHAAGAFATITGINVCVIDIHNLKYPKIDSLTKILEGFKSIISFEENYLSGLAAFLSKVYMQSNMKTKILSIGIPEKFIFEGTNRNELRETFGLDQNSITEVLKKHFVI